MDNFIPKQKDMKPTNALIKQKLHFIIERIRNEKNTKLFIFY